MTSASPPLARAPSGPLAAGVANDHPKAPLDPAFSGLARLAARVCQSGLASVQVAGAGAAWCGTASAMPSACVPRHDAFAAFASAASPLFEVTDAAADERFRDAEMVSGKLAVRFYAGCALLNSRGELLGVLSVYDTTPRSLSAGQRASLLLIADQAVALADCRARLTELTLLNWAPICEPARHASNALAIPLIDSAAVAIYHVDAAGNMTYANPEYRRIFGITTEEGPHAWEQHVHPDDLAYIVRAWADFKRQPRPMRFDNYRTVLGGRTRYFSEQVVAAAGIEGFVGTISDFTDLVTVRSDLRKVEALYSNTFDQAPIGIAYVDRDGRFQSYNQCFSAMLGYSPVDLANKTVTDLTHGDDVAAAAAETARLWNGEIEFFEVEKRYVRRDGSVLWVHVMSALVREENANPEYSVQFLRDVTARKESADELERVHRELMLASRQAGMAEVATNVLHNVGNILNSVNISASLVAERVKQCKGPVISRLSALLQQQGDGIGDFMAKDERGKRIPEYLAGLGEQLQNDQTMALQELGSLRENLEHIKDTVAMQQSYARRCGVTETVEVADLVEDSLRLNAGAFVRHGVTLRREFNRVPKITVDKHKVLQILVNLVRNAKYACDESGRTDKLITLRVDDPGNGCVHIAVIDNGVGIPAENMSRLFSHGFTTRQSGHGFGLHSGAVAAQELGGTLHAQSDGPGTGAAFILKVPCTPAEHRRG